MKIEKGKCPICGKDNACAAVKGTDPAKCWCMTAKIPKGLLQTIPDELRNQSCVCQTCVDKYKKESQ